MTTLVSELREIHAQLRSLVDSADVERVPEPIGRMEASAHPLGRAANRGWVITRASCEAMQIAKNGLRA